jgi:outer membrane receptor protein involved in Fe transport
MKLSRSVLLLPILLAEAGTLAAQENQEGIEELVVTGSNVVRDGYTAPTPTSVVNRDAINTFSGTNIGDYLAQLPVFAGNQTPINTRRSTSAGGAGISSLNMRNLGTARTLVLLDGQRVVASQPTGQIDINPFPQQLIQRVDVVTGGASAVYGSDALAGAVNFVLDRHFTGYKFEAQGGMTDDGDNVAKNATASAGLPFADGRGHVLLSGEYSLVDGIEECLYDYCTEGWNMIDNPAYTATNGLPQRIVLDRSAPNNMTAGGIITAGPLKGTAFGPGGVPYQYDYGTLVGTAFSQGGDWAENSVQKYTSVAPYAERRNVFARASYKLTDNMEVFAQYSKGINDSLVASAVRFYPGTLRIQRDNAFMPASVRDQMIARNLTTLNFGTYNDDLGTIRSKNKVDLDRSVLGIDGDFAMLGSDWTYSAYFEYGKSINTKQFWDSLKTPYSLGIDAVVNPATGNIVCRSTLTSPNNGCVPYNVFGTGVNSAAAVNYVAGWSYAKENNTQKVISGKISGSPFAVPAGEVSLALGLEHRVEDGNGVESENNARNESTFGNQAPIFGKYDVTDAFAETVIPLFTAMPTEFNAAVRRSDYSTSGTVTTWKTGLTFQPHNDVLIRGYLSHDIRSPSRRELFATTLFAGNQVLDPFLGGAASTANTLTVGNPNLRPEVADSTGIGVVYTSSLLEGFSASVDYYDIDIEDSIGSVGAQARIDRCFGGETVFCSSLVRKADGTLQHILIQPVNYVLETNRGIDFESSYRFSASALASSLPGDIEFRALATHYLESSVDTGDRPEVVDSVGSNGNGPPNWKFTVTGTYRLDNMRVSLTGRGLSSGVIDPTFIECTTGCPPSTTFNRTIDDNSIDGAVFFDLSMSYTMDDLFNTESELFLVVQNLTDKDPEIFPRYGANPVDPASNPTYYDILGRELRFGFRTQF